MKRLSVILFILLFETFIGSVSAYSQQKNNKEFSKASVKGIGRAYEDSIVLRWSPDKAAAWIMLNATGYAILRIDLSDPKHPQKEVLNTKPVKPLTLEQMKSTLDRNNRYAAIAAQALYGKNFEVTTQQGFAGGIADKASALNNRFVFTLLAADYSAPVASAVGLSFTDKKVKKDAWYVYKIYPAATLRNTIIDTATVILQNKKDEKINKPEGIGVVNADHAVSLYWNRYQQESYSGYFIEKSDDGGKSFKSLNLIPFYTSAPDTIQSIKDSAQQKMFGLLKYKQVFSDSLKENYKKYLFRIRGINAFAELSGYSEVVEAIGRDLMPPSPPQVNPAKIVGKRKIRLSWNKKIKEPDLLGYYVTRATTINGNYLPLNKQLLDKDKTEFIDTAAIEHENNFYIIAAIDTAKNYSASSPVMAILPDTIAPAIPVGVKGIITQKGLVHLSWNRNTEVDMKGYKVYFANNDKHVFSQLTSTSIKDTIFTDSITLKTLTKDIYYRVVAVDKNNNHSDYSSILTLRKPDIIPPPAPVARNVNVSNKAVDIDWIQSSSDDAIAYIIYRKENSGGWDIITRQKHNPSVSGFHFTDMNIKPNIDYTYAAETIDEDSLHSAKSHAVPVKIYAVSQLPAITTLQASYENKKKTVELTWNYTEPGDYFFILYRGNKNTSLSRFHSVDKSNRTFSDNELAAGTDQYQYAIQAIFKDGRGETIMSNQVGVAISKK